MSTGFHFVDSLTSGGVAEGEVVLLLAYSGVGKTTIGCHQLLCNPDVQRVFFSLEMQARYITKRLAAMHTDTPDREIERALRAGQGSPAIAQLARDHRSLWLVDKPGMSLKEMGRCLSELEAETGEKTKLVLIDYMELIGGVASLDGMGQVDKVSRSLKNFANEHDVAVVVLHQLTKGSSPHERVSIQDARFGGNVAADYVMGAWKPGLDPTLSRDQSRALERDLWVNLVKTRGGPYIDPYGVRHDYDPETMRITDPLKPRPNPVDQRELW